ncbi:neural cell adhesion molecule 1-like, partial [Pseudonaja textilis]|uniref:neural cell adhesion molecule 1-like n=1 Tax=Pseudonaja textilis TaxID=8673 RepID=UPI000EA8A175
STTPTSGLGTAAIVGILIVIFILLMVAVDITCYFLNKCGLFMCIAVNLCGKAGPGAKGKDMEEGKAAFSKDESKEPIVEVRTEEERTPNHDGGKHTEPNETTPLTEPEHPADTVAATEDMMPSVTTVTTNSDTITETFATAQNSPTSETTTLTSSITLPDTPIPNATMGPPSQGTPSKAAAPSPPPASAPKVAPLVDLSDTPASPQAAGNLSSNVLNHQGAVLSPSSTSKGPEAPKGPAIASPPSNPASLPDSSEAKQEAASSARSPEKESARKSAAKSPTEALKTAGGQKGEAAPGGTRNPPQNEDFKMDEGTFKTPDLDLAKDVFAALGTAAPAVEAPAAAPASALETSASPAPAKTEKNAVEEKPAVPATEANNAAPAEVKTVPNEATQTNETESKA